MTSGVHLNDDVKKIFEKQMKKRSKGKSDENHLKLLCLKLNDGLTEIVLDEDFPRVVTWENVLGSLPVTEPRYIIYDFPYKPEGREVFDEKLIFMFWCPPECPIKLRMVYAASKDYVKALGDFGRFVFQADCKDDCSEAVISEKLAK